MSMKEELRRVHGSKPSLLNYRLCLCKHSAVILNCIYKVALKQKFCCSPATHKK